MSEQCGNAARELEKRKNWRSATNRYYYAAFSAITAHLRKRTMEFPNGYEHPPHRQVGRFIKRYLVELPKADRDELRDALARLYRAREDADYRHEISLAHDTVRQSRLDYDYVKSTIETLTPA